MTFWIALWKGCLIAALLAFAGLSIRVTIGGAADLRRLLRRLREDGEQG